MDPTTEILSQSRRTRSSNTASSQQPTPTYGYHNTFHTHAQLPLGAPPTYARATEPQTLWSLQEKARSEAEVANSTPLPPSYSCSVSASGALGMKQELSSPFAIAGNREWFETFAVLEGTQLSFYRVKNPSLLSKNKSPTAGRFLRSYTLQHAEVGIASDFRKTALIPKSPFAHLVPSSARAKLYETDPHLFEPVREHVIRLRLETEQFLLCANTAESMLSWLELLCAAIDISAPIEDRSEPRYRSLPRRSRRQRILDSAQLTIEDTIDSLSSLEAGRRIIAQQEQIIRHLYPHLAASREPGSTSTPQSSSPTQDLDLDDFDPDDVRFPTSRQAVRLSASQEIDGSTRTSLSEEDRKNMERLRPNPAQNLRYRRRCAPVLLASSPRVSDVVFSNGKRMRINVRDHMLVDYTPHPPRYDAHRFPRSKRSSRVRNSTSSIPESTLPSTGDVSTHETRAPAPCKHHHHHHQIVHIPSRPSSPMRATSDDSFTSISFEEDVSTMSASSTASPSGDEITPENPTHGNANVKTDQQQQQRVVELAKKRTSEEVGIGEVALRVGLLV